MNITWALEQDDFNESDRLWCQGLGVNIHEEPLKKDVYLSGHFSYSIHIGRKIRLTTTTPQQETMLKLKYGFRLIEVQRSRDCTSKELKDLDF